MDVTVALDIGGTKIAAGLVDADGTLVHQAKLPTPDGDAEAVWTGARRRRRLCRSNRPSGWDRQPHQYHCVARLSDSRAGVDADRCARAAWRRRAVHGVGGAVARR